MRRYQKEAIIRDLEKKMVLLAGPRQAGKTTLAKEIASSFSSSTYLNYDNVKDQAIIHDHAWLPEAELLIFDEIHKMKNWKNFLKGVYDTKPGEQKILVTGSARLEIFNQVGDSLAGRFFLHRLFPLSAAELVKVGMAPDIDRLLERGGFPEPYLTNDSLDAKRWRSQYTDSLLKEDVLDFESIQNVRAIRLLFELLRSKVGSPISYSSLARDLEISPNSVKKYIHILEALYIVFRVTPFSHTIARSLLKEPKIYFFDTGLVKGDKGACFENLVANALLKHVTALIDYKAEPARLHYLRTKEHKEVDFALVNNESLEHIVEVKYKKDSLSAPLLYFKQKYDLDALMLVKSLQTDHIEKDIPIRSALSYLPTLEL